MPAVIVCDHGDCGVTDLRLTCEFGFLEIGHADHVHAPGAIQIRFRACRELRPLDTDVSATTLSGHAGFVAALRRSISNFGADGICQGYVRDQSVAEKCGDALPRAVDKLVWNHKIHWLVLFLERAHGGH